MKRNRLAAIDIGTNSIRCIVVEVDQQSRFRVLDDEKATVRLGAGITQCNTIAEAGWQQAIEALVRMKKIIDGFGVIGVETIATSAVRRATNGGAFVKAVADTVGLQIDVISGEEEAELAALSALHNFNMEGIRYAIVDIGGGSVEIVTAWGSHIEEIYSLDLGAVVLTEHFITTDPIKRGEYLRLRKHIRNALKAALIDESMAFQSIVGSGGTMTTIAAMVMAMRKEGYHSVHGYEVLHSDVVHLLAMLRHKDLKERKSLPELPPDRADIIIAGVTVVDELMELLNANLLKINERGIREGLILRGLKKHHLLPDERHPRNWRDAALDYARSCHYDEEHAGQVAKLALEMFAAVEATFGFGDKERQLLEAAALLHDVGYFISYSGHHKHTYHLVRHADLFGFTPRERELIAQIGRYHRKTLPKKKHESFARLASGDKLLVERLGGILRLADGLDRRRNSLVTGLDCSLSPAAFLIRVTAAGDVSVELFGAKAKGDLFERAFDRKVLLVPASAPF